MFNSNDFMDLEKWLLYFPHLEDAYKASPQAFKPQTLEHAEFHFTLKPAPTQTCKPPTSLLGTCWLAAYEQHTVTHARTHSFPHTLI